MMVWMCVIHMCIGFDGENEHTHTHQPSPSTTITAITNNIDDDFVHIYNDKYKALRFRSCAFVFVRLFVVDDYKNIYGRSSKRHDARQQYT